MQASDDQTLVSALVIPAPPPVAAFVEAFRREHPGQDSYALPPHITVMWPFISPGTLSSGPDEALLRRTADRLRRVCREIQPFTVVLDRYGTFPGGVLYLAPRDPAPIVALHKRILAEFPEYPPYGGEYGEYVPHMTLGFFETMTPLEVVPRPVLEPLDLPVDRLCFMYGDQSFSRPWVNAAVIPLGTGSGL